MSPRLPRAHLPHSPHNSLTEGVTMPKTMTRPRPSAWHTIGRALGMVAALPARAVGMAIAHRPQLIPLLIHTRLVLDWRHARKARRP